MNLDTVPSIYTDPTNNRIVCAANRFTNNDNPSDVVVFIGARHGDTWMQKQWRFCPTHFTTHTKVEGFIDQRGNFYTRTEAWKVALAEGQIIRRCGGDSTDGGTLYSENLY